jgi:two-component system, NarL family, sensor histidine kinase DesK
MPWRLLAVVPIVVFVLVIGATGIIDGERVRTQAQLRRADEEITRLAAIAERERIARDLHDLLGHTLSVIVLKAELASRLVPADPDRAGQEMRDVEQTARTALGEVRTAVAGYRAKGLGAELVNSQRALASAGVEADATVDLPVLPAEQEAALALALREAVTNVLRHADAHRTSIRARATINDVELEVTDDGRGASGRDGAGLSGMRERVRALGGQVDLQSGAADSARPGTRVFVRLPRTAPHPAVPTAAAGQ